MVSKVEVSSLRRQESMKRSSKPENEVKGKQEVVRLQKVCKFKRSSFSEEEDATSTAILLLACVSQFVVAFPD
ncbi:hypothetical protein Cni_G21552 [Canna indica]|uniref:Uncharacterized protein n=1 Tax=Canna indica TaxID=4628 RepID=A0AAQ3KQW1_9LILI|nr:hypothetical protein Cni_G21552 [Canna indica]